MKNGNDTVADYATTNQTLLDAGFVTALAAVRDNQDQEKKVSDSATKAVDETYVYVSKIKGTPEFEAECIEVGCTVRLPDATRNSFLKPNKLICGKVRVKDGKSTFEDRDRPNTSKRSTVHQYLDAMGVPATPGEAKKFIGEIDLGGGSVSACLAKARAYFNAEPEVQSQILAISGRVGDIGTTVPGVEVSDLPTHGVVPFSIIDGNIVIAHEFATGGDSDFLSKAGEIEPDLGVFSRFYKVAKDHGHTGDAADRKSKIYGHNDGKGPRGGFLIQQVASYGAPYIRSETQLAVPMLQFETSVADLEGFAKMWGLFPWYETVWKVEGSKPPTATFLRKRVAEIKQKVDAEFAVPDVFESVSGTDNDYIWPLISGVPQHDVEVDDPYVDRDHAGYDIVSVPPVFATYVANHVSSKSHNPKDHLGYENGEFRYLSDKGVEKICDAPGSDNSHDIKLTAVEFDKAFKAVRKFTKHGELMIAMKDGHWVLFKKFAGLEFGVVLQDRKEG